MIEPTHLLSPTVPAAAFTGCILGMAAGDSLGLPCEGLPRSRAFRMFGPAPLRQRLFFGRGMVSDDTEHTIMVAEALLKAGDDPDRFARALAARLRVWLLALPAGAGLATLRACLKLCLGWGPGRSGVYSAGNGPAMRAPLLGVACAGQDEAQLAAFVHASTCLTHTDPRAEQGALLIAMAARYGALHGPPDDAEAILLALQAIAQDPQLRQFIDAIEPHLLRQASAAEFADSLGLQKGVSGFVNHTVPVALYCWLRHPRDFREAVESVIILGGDTDTTGAIVGGLAGITLGVDAIPVEWLANLAEWPRTTAWMRLLASRLAERAGTPLRPPPYFGPGVLLRNFLFFWIILAHGFRRLLSRLIERYFIDRAREMSRGVQA